MTVKIHRVENGWLVELWLGKHRYEYVYEKYEDLLTDVTGAIKKFEFGG